ncbi:MAG: 3-oxoacyl-ACP synthase III [Chitinophagaceae bacterium]|nr:3-oxoacyl-ACP synthase III [Chitinophagaceae bacterium]
MQTSFSNVSILTLAHIVGPNILTSVAIEERLIPTYKRLGFKKGMIEKMTGIIERRYWDTSVQPSDIATQVATKCIEKANIPAEKIGLLINTSVCRDYIEPSVACLIHGNLKLPANCLNFDITNACLGFINGMHVAGLMIENGSIDYALIVNAENPIFGIEKTIEKLAQDDCTLEYFQNNLATLTLGCGGAAMLLCRKELAPDSPEFLGGVFRSNSDYNRLCIGQIEQMQTDTRMLLKTGITLGIETAKLAKWDEEHFDLFIPHQVSNNYIVKICEALNIDFSKNYLTYPLYGNMGPTSVPFALSKASSENIIKKGDLIGLLGFGSGINCGLMKIQW